MASANGDEHSDQAPLAPLAPEPRARRSGSNPTIRQRELGLRLRDLRSERGLTVDEVARRLLCSPTKISRLETGARRASQRDVRDLCQLYGIHDPAQQEFLMSLAKQAHESGWWTQYEDLSLDPYIGLEDEALAITAFSMYWLPALLQTAEYARAIISGIAPRTSAKVIDERVEARMRRQLILDRTEPPSYRAILDEAVLRRKVGGPEATRRQLAKVIELGESRKATIQVIPFTLGAYSAAEGNFDFLEFPDNMRQGPIVYIEGLTGNLYLERQAEIQRYREVIDNLRDSALGTRDSMALISEINSGDTSLH